MRGGGGADHLAWGVMNFVKAQSACGESRRDEVGESAETGNCFVTPSAQKLEDVRAGQSVHGSEKRKRF